MTDTDTSGNGFFSLNQDKNNCRDSGMAMVLILLLLGYLCKNNLFYQIAIPVLVMDMIIPKFFYPFAIVWFGIANVLGSIVSKILLTVVYIIIVLPIGLIRRLSGKDSLQLKNFKKDKGSVMVERNVVFTKEHIVKPY